EGLRGTGVVWRRHSRHLLVPAILAPPLERALLRGGTPSARLVQYRSVPRIKLNIVESVEPAGAGLFQMSGPREPQKLAPLADEKKLGDALTAVGSSNVEVRNGTMYEVRTDERPGERTLGLDQMPEPILYKLLGSQDVVDSCTISTDQYYDAIALSIAQKTIPEVLTQIISNTPMIFLGSRILDPDFRLAYALLRQALESGRG